MTADRVRSSGGGGAVVERRRKAEGVVRLLIVDLGSGLGERADEGCLGRRLERGSRERGSALRGGKPPRRRRRKPRRGSRSGHPCAAVIRRARVEPVSLRPAAAGPPHGLVVVVRLGEGAKAAPLRGAGRVGGAAVLREVAVVVVVGGSSYLGRGDRPGSSSRQGCMTRRDSEWRRGGRDGGAPITVAARAAHRRGAGRQQQQGGLRRRARGATRNVVQLEPHIRRHRGRSRDAAAPQNEAGQGVCRRRRFSV